MSNSMDRIAARLEPDLICQIDDRALLASVAISLKRIADALEQQCQIIVQGRDYVAQEKQPWRRGQDG